LGCGLKYVFFGYVGASSEDELVRARENQLKIPVELVPNRRQQVTSGWDGGLSIEQSGADAEVDIGQPSYLSANKGSQVNTVDV